MNNSDVMNIALYVTVFKNLKYIKVTNSLKQYNNYGSLNWTS